MYTISRQSTLCVHTTSLLIGDFHLQLDDVNWRLTLHMCQASMLHMKEPNAILELSVRDDNSGVRFISCISYCCSCCFSPSNAGTCGVVVGSCCCM